LREILKIHRRVVFDGDNYSQEWQDEALNRGLPNLKTAPDAFPALVTQQALDMFEHYHVLSNRELQAREEVLLEQYSTIVSIEARTLIMMLSTKVLPAALRYQGELASIISASTANSVDCSRSLARLGDVARLSESIQEAIELLQGLMNNEYEDSQEHANFVRDSLIPSMNVARTISDHLEELVPDDIWPLPSYTEMLFIR
jgi:glutamine synthetase